MKTPVRIEKAGRVESAARFVVQLAALSLVGAGFWDISRPVAMIVIGAIVIALSLVGRLRA